MYAITGSLSTSSGVLASGNHHLVPDGLRPSLGLPPAEWRLDNLALALVQVMNADDPAALDAMVDRFATATDRRSRRPCCPHLLCLRGEALRTGFQREGSTADIEDSVHCLHQALEGFPSDGHLRASVLSALGAALTLRFRRTANACRPRPDVPVDLGRAAPAPEVSLWASSTSA
jgi:hypothetical protein